MNIVPVLAAEIPTLEHGGVKQRADGGTDVTWKLRPGVKWHDDDDRRGPRDSPRERAQLLWRWRPATDRELGNMLYQAQTTMTTEPWLGIFRACSSS